MLGWNIIYGFNDSDFEVSENLLSLYLDEYEETPWDALKYLIADVNYGGHVTDDWDRRLMQSYIYDYFTDEAIGAQYFKLSTLDQVRYGNQPNKILTKYLVLHSKRWSAKYLHRVYQYASKHRPSRGLWATSQR